LHRTKQQQQERSLYVENIYNTELNDTKNNEATSRDLEQQTPQGGEESLSELPMGVLEKTTNSGGKKRSISQGTEDKKTDGPLGVVKRRTKFPVGVVEESTDKVDKQTEPIKTLSKQVRLNKKVIERLTTQHSNV